MRTGVVIAALLGSIVGVPIAGIAALAWRAGWLVAALVSVAALLGVVRTFSAGLCGVWGVYVWYCASRVVAFASFGGLLVRRRRG